MEPMNKFLISHRAEFKAYVDAVCSIPAERPTQAVSPSYATPIQILGRLPPTSREGFPSLPFLIDHARSFAALVNLWLEVAPDRLGDLSECDPNLLAFHNLCLELRQRTKDCLSKAEQAERPSGNLEMKWEELVEQIEKSNTFYDDSSSKPNTPSAETTMMGAAAAVGGNRNSIGYFSRPPLPHRTTDIGQDADDETPPSSASAIVEHGKLPFRYAEPLDSTSNSKNSSVYSLDQSDGGKSRQANASRDISGKHRILDFVGASQSRRKAREGSQQQHRREERNEF